MSCTLFTEHRSASFRGIKQSVVYFFTHITNIWQPKAKPVQDLTWFFYSFSLSPELLMLFAFPVSCNLFLQFSTKNDVSNFFIP